MKHAIGRAAFALPSLSIAPILSLQRREEALHRCIVPDVARTAHRTDDAVIGHQPLELLADVLAAAIGVM
jgi:hypothetical protein